MSKLSAVIFERAAPLNPPPSEVAAIWTRPRSTPNTPSTSIGLGASTSQTTIR
ncbi:hypothetical protein [Candidatus Villigracilis saccharophilus]|uniref:hypothetical protein n=1 Tax=Candidatus Villigracilis saccharophilus TaxID=3140684 RepID=UPI0031370D69|nr:hypothetical protein [Anaerolineales bacterium]